MSKCRIQVLTIPQRNLNSINSITMKKEGNYLGNQMNPKIS